MYLNLRAISTHSLRHTTNQALSRAEQGRLAEQPARLDYGTGRLPRQILGIVGRILGIAGKWLQYEEEIVPRATIVRVARAVL